MILSFREWTNIMFQGLVDNLWPWHDKTSTTGWLWMFCSCSSKVWVLNAVSKRRDGLRKVGMDFEKLVKPGQFERPGDFGLRIEQFQLLLRAASLAVDGV